MLKVDHKIVIAYTTTNVIGVTTVFVKYPDYSNLKQRSGHIKIDIFTYILFMANKVVHTYPTAH